MSQYQLLKEQLQEMFQLDRGDLDFGIYRIMNQKREEVTDFLDKQLLPQVREILEQANPDNNAQVQAELDGVMKTLLDLGVDPETNPKVLELKAKLGASVDLSKMENEIYSDMLNFFKRYYSDGDFMSMRRYKEGVYAMPYEGEEVKLHWANHDQYYIKTSESLTNYTFKAGKKRVRFELINATTEKNNNKATEGKERRFILHEDAPTTVSGDEMIIRFEYKAGSEKRPQDKSTKTAQSYNDQTYTLLKDRAEIDAFGLLELSPTEKKKERTLLEKHLTDFTSKNSFDYFIHKDLGKFLRRELDFFIKNEIMHLDDIENEAAPKIESYLAKIKALRKVAGKIISFLAQLEDFQKKLWLKKKFVLESHYCITIDQILKHEDAEAILKTIASNDAQREEWVKLFAINEIEGDLSAPAYTSPLTVEFLKANDKLLIDTKFYDTKFKYQVISGFDDLDAQTDGLMINSENFQALNLLRDRYREQVKCIYIDPPYNTGNDGFAYKDSYQHSSWASMIFDRVSSSQLLLSSQGFFWGHIDYNENWTFKKVLDNIFSNDGFVNEILWKRRGGSSNPSNQLGIITDTIYLYRNSDEAVLKPVYTKNSEEAKNYIKERFTEKDADGRLYMKSPIVSPNYRENLCYDYKGYKHPPNGWSITLELMQKWDAIGKLYFPKTGNRIYRKIYLDEYQGQPIQNLWLDIHVINPMALERVDFATQKPISLLKRVMDFSTEKDSTILDYFAGSGTTGHAVINLNREDQGNRKYILVEMGAYFNSVTKPRMQKATYYSNKRKDGKLTSKEGVSHLMKYLTLEQYEDTLDNLNFERNKTQSSLLAQNPTLNEEYLLSYMLDVESRGSQSLLNVDAFANPFDYQLRITRDDDTQLVNVDLVETFNYLLGLIVETIQLESNGILSVTGKTNNPNGEGKRCLILWRNVSEVDNETLDDWFKKRYSAKDFEFDSIYINGDNHIENLKLDDDHWKVQLIESEFQKLMFSTQDV